MNTLAPLSPDLLPTGIRTRIVPGINGLSMHVLEAGYETPDRPALLLLHGFPELAYSWRKVMVPLAEAGYHVIAPDQRGYGRTIGWDGAYDGDLVSFRFFNLVRDALGLVNAFGYRNVAAVIGHDFGSPVAAWCATLRPDVFKAVALMSAPFGGPPKPPFDTLGRGWQTNIDPIHDELAALERPRKHYQWYYSTRAADADMRYCAQGVHDFLRAYYHHKSADWADNRPYPLEAWRAAQLAQMPTYYIMDLAQNMAETVAPHMPAPEAIAANRWLPDRELAVYSEAFAHNGFQGGLQWYRCTTSGQFDAELEIFGGRTIDIPSCFIAGRSDWGVYQRPGHFERMQESVCTRMHDVHLVEGAGHWVQQEQPEETVRLLLRFLERARAG